MFSMVVYFHWKITPEGIPCFHTQQEPPPEVWDCGLSSNFFVYSLVPMKVAQFLGFFTF